MKRKDEDSMTMLGDKRKFFGIWYSLHQASQVAPVVKNLPANAGRHKRWWVRSLGQEDSLEEGTQPTPEFLSGESHRKRIPRTEEPVGQQSIGSHRVGHD